MKIWKLIFCLSLLSLGISSAHADYLPLRADVQGEQPGVAILQRSPDQFVMEIKLPGLVISEGTLEGKRWDRVLIPGGSQSSDPGAPEVPHFSRLLIIPATKSVQAEFEALETTTLKDFELIPYQRFQPDEPMPEGEEVRYDMATYTLNGLYPPDRVLVGEPAVMRGLRVVVLRTNPVQYNPVTKELQVVTRYRINVRFTGTDLRNVPRRQFALSKTWVNMMRGVSFNFEDSELDEQNMGSYLVVCENDANLLSSLLPPLIEWKRRKGHTVAVQTFSPGASSSTIKTIIQNAYNVWEIPPEFVLLFGDTGQDFALPGWSPSGIDHPYTQLDGTDILADVAIGRLPADNSAEAVIMINKVLFYEKMPYIAEPQWLKQGCLVAGSSLSGFSTIQTNRWIKTKMIEHEFSRIDTFWYNMGSGSVQATISNAVNNVGVSYVNYRGWLGMENFELSHIEQMTNGRKLPFVSTITCGTGGFDAEESFMEHFVSWGSATSGNAAVACIGTATSSTHTRYNNTVNIGIFAGIFDEGLTQAGTALVRGKLELYWAYNFAEASAVSSYSLWNALAGDPGLELFNSAILGMTANVPATVTYGDNSLNLTVAESSADALAGATVCVYKDSSMQYVGETNAQGQVTLPLTGIPAGNVKVTITKHNYYPIVDSLDLVQANVAVGYYSHSIDDDNSGGSSGNSDGVLNPGETVEVPLIFKNYGTTTTATAVNVAATESDDYGTLLDNSETFPDIAPGAVANSDDDFDLAVSSSCPNGHVIRMILATTTAQGTWDGILDLPVVSYSMLLNSAQATGGDTLVSPGETANLVLYVRNIGDRNATSLTATLTPLDSYVTVNDNSASFGNVNIGSVANCGGDPFNVTAASNTPPGHLADLLVIYSADGATQADTFTIALGLRTQADPQGPDAYGYFCYDNLDINYGQCPIYAWIEIDPNYGGSGGTQVTLGDYGNEQDKSAVVNLPFTFQYYGLDYNQITVCSNGWISMSANASFTDFRNYPIPSGMGPDGQIAPFWEDLIETSGTPGGHVYTKNDAANHSFIIEYSRMKLRQSTSVIETFEIILFDPAYFPTLTGDGEILFQYNTVSNTASGDNSYCTTGIESPDYQTGLQVTYWNAYLPMTASLTAGRAYFFSPDLDFGPQAPTVDITLIPINPPIQIPAGGGSFSYDITITNGGTSPATFDVWIMQKLPDGSWLGPMLGPVNVLLNPSATIMRNRNQNVPARAPAGTYYYTGYVGVYSGVKWDSSYFTYTKLASGDGVSVVNNWDNWGESFDPWMASGEIVPIGSVPREFAMRDAYPNPFNPAATLTFELPQASLVRLDIFDLQGRVVAELVNGMRDAGVHQVVWDASGQASGLYFCRIKAGEYSAGRKMMLVK